MSLWVPKLRAEYIIEGALYQEALDYARRSRAYTSDRHDFHSGGLDNKQQKMLEGKLGEKAFKLFLQDNGIRFEEDHSSYEERDEYDFLLQGSGLRLRVDVKTRTEEFHIRTLELVEQTISHPKELYVSAGSTGSGMRSGCWGGSPGRICSPRGRSKTRAIWITM